MSRRQKGPTTEELLQKLTTEFYEYKTNNDEMIEKIKSENQENIERFNENSLENFGNVNLKFASIETELQKKIEFFEEKNVCHEKTFNEMQESITCLDEKIQNDVQTLDAKLEKSEEYLKSLIENDRREVAVNISENNEQVMGVVNNVTSDMKKDTENIHDIIKSNQESNILKISELTREMNAMTESFHGKMEENFNLLVSRMDNDSKNTESLKDGQDVEVSKTEPKNSLVTCNADESHKG